MLDEIIYDIVDDSNEEESHESDGRNLDYGHEKSDSHEGSTAKKALLTMAKDLYHLYITLNDNDDLPEWCHYKLATSRKDLSDVTDYITSKILKHCLDNKIDHEGLQEAIKLSMKGSLNEGMFKNFASFFKGKKKIKGDNTRTKPVEKIDLGSPQQNLDDTQPISQSTINSIAIDQIKKNPFYTVYDSIIKSSRIISGIENLSPTQFDFLKKKKSTEEYNEYDEYEMRLAPIERIVKSVLKEKGYITITNKLISFLTTRSTIEESLNNNPDFKVLRELVSDGNTLYVGNESDSALNKVNSMNRDEFIYFAKDFVDKMSLLMNKDDQQIIKELKSSKQNLIYIVSKLVPFISKESISKDKVLNNCLKRLELIKSGEDNVEIESFAQRKITPFRLKSASEQRKYSYINLKEKNPYFIIYDNATVIADYYEKYLNNNIVSIDTLTTFYKSQSAEFLNNSHDDFLSAKNNLDNIINIIDQLEKDTRLFRESYELNSSFENKRLKSVHKFLTNSLPSIEARLKNINICFSIINNCDVKVKSLLINDLEKMEKKSIYDLYEELKTNINSFKNIYEIIL